MRVSVDFSELSEAMGYANTVLSDKSVDDKSKNFIFSITKDKFLVIGYSSFIFSRTEVENWSIVEDLPETGWSFQVKASELNKIVSSFSSLYRTKVSGIHFYDEGVRVGVEVHEEPIDEEDSKLKQDSKFFLENAPITGKVMEEILTEFPTDGVSEVDSGELCLYLETLFPLMNNDSSSSMASKINFAEDYVFVVTSMNAAFMENRLPDALKGFCLNYSSAMFLKKIGLSVDGGISIAKLDNYLCTQAGNTEAFMRYQRVKINYKMYVERRSKDTGIVVDRLYLKDVLKRMGNFSQDGKVTIIDETELKVENSNFNQSIPLNNAKGEINGVEFNVSINTLEKLILGSDDVFSDDLHIYFVPATRGYIIYVSDKTGAWFSNMQVKK